MNIMMKMLVYGIYNFSWKVFCKELVIPLLILIPLFILIFEVGMSQPGSD